MSAPSLVSFLGVDPDKKGAACLLGVVNRPDHEDHGKVTMFAVVDLTLRPRDDGEDVDPVALIRDVSALGREHGLTGFGGMPYIDRAIVERPSFGGRGFGAKSAVAQAWNAAGIWGALLVLGGASLACGLVEQANPTGGKWYAEAGCPCPKGQDRKQESLRAAAALLVEWNRHGGVLAGQDFSLAKPEKDAGRADAILLANLARLRWLGQTHQPANAGKAASSAARWTAIRHAEVKRQFAGGFEARARKVARVWIGCPTCGVKAPEPCGVRMCPARIWASAASLKAGGQLIGAADALKAFAGLIPASPIFHRIAMVRLGGKWSWLDGRVVPPDALQAAIDHGHVRLDLDGKKHPVWVVTDCGLAFARGLLGEQAHAPDDAPPLSR